jgi:hypothetical protein
MPTALGWAATWAGSSVPAEVGTGEGRRRHDPGCGRWPSGPCDRGGIGAYRPAGGGAGAGGHGGCGLAWPLRPDAPEHQPSDVTASRRPATGGVWRGWSGTSACWTSAARQLRSGSARQRRACGSSASSRGPASSTTWAWRPDGPPVPSPASCAGRRQPASRPKSIASGRQGPRPKLTTRHEMGGSCAGQDPDGHGPWPGRARPGWWSRAGGSRPAAARGLRSADRMGRPVPAGSRATPVRSVVVRAGRRPARQCRRDGRRAAASAGVQADPASPPGPTLGQGPPGRNPGTATWPVASPTSGCIPSGPRWPLAGA